MHLDELVHVQLHSLAIFTLRLGNMLKTITNMMVSEQSHPAGY